MRPVETCWNMLKHVWNMLKHVEKCWNMLNHVEKCWKILNHCFFFQSKLGALQAAKEDRPWKPVFQFWNVETLRLYSKSSPRVKLQLDSKPIYQLVTERRFRRVHVATQLSGYSFCFHVKTFILGTISPDWPWPRRFIMTSCNPTAKLG